MKLIFSIQAYGHKNFFWTIFIGYFVLLCCCLENLYNGLWCLLRFALWFTDIFINIPCVLKVLPNNWVIVYVSLLDLAFKILFNSFNYLPPTISYHRYLRPKFLFVTVNCFIDFKAWVFFYSWWELLHLSLLKLTFYSNTYFFHLKVNFIWLIFSQFHLIGILFH